MTPGTKVKYATNMLKCGASRKQRGIIVEDQGMGLDSTRFVRVHWQGWPEPTLINRQAIRKA